VSGSVTRIEIVAAVRNEEASLPAFVERVRALPLPDRVVLRIVFVEDSSTDSTLEVLRALAATDPEIAFFSLERGFGQGPAIVFGLSQSTADAFVLMDVDGSHPPECIPELVALHLDGAEVVQCVRRSLAARPLHRRIATACFQRLATLLVGIDLTEQAIYFRLVSRRFARALVAEPLYWRFLRFPLPRGAGELARIEIDTTERIQGESQYGILRLAGLAIDAILSLIPPRRFGIAVGLSLVGIAVALGRGVWPVALGLVGITILALLRRRVLGRADWLSRMRVRESANASRPTT